MMTPTQQIARQAILSVAHKDYGKMLNAYARFKISDRSTGEDLVQDTFLKTWAYLARGGEIHVMKSFLYHVLNNLIVDEYRKRKATSLDVLLENGYEPSFDYSKNLYDRIDGRAALLLIPHLPQRYQKVMYMRYVQDLTLKEMSFVTGQSRNTMAVQLHRGIHKLKVLYER